jgi:hypothetical protein
MLRRSFYTPAMHLPNPCFWLLHISLEAMVGRRSQPTTAATNRPLMVATRKVAIHRRVMKRRAVIHPRHSKELFGDRQDSRAEQAAELASSTEQSPFSLGSACKTIAAALALAFVFENICACSFSNARGNCLQIWCVRLMSDLVTFKALLICEHCWNAGVVVASTLPDQDLPITCKLIVISLCHVQQHILSRCEYSQLIKSKLRLRLA